MPQITKCSAISDFSRALKSGYINTLRDFGCQKCVTWVERIFVHWAVEHFDWPGKSAEEIFSYNKAINEYEFPPLEVLQ